MVGERYDSSYIVASLICITIMKSYHYYVHFTTKFAHFQIFGFVGYGKVLNGSEAWFRQF